MRKQVIIIAVAIIVNSYFSMCYAQRDVAIDPNFGARLSVSVDKKLAKGLHLQVEEEIRLDDWGLSLDRLHTTLGLSYKVHPNIKLGIGYAMINPYSTVNSAFRSSRHRLMLDATGSIRFGDWRLSLKERFQATYRTGEMNEYQNPRTALTLKSRIKVSYKGFQRMEPYAYFELRNTLNAPVIKANYDGTNYLTDAMSQVGEAGWFIDGWNGIYVNRLRSAIGFDYRIDKRNDIDVSIMADRIMDKVVDANSEGTKLKSYTRELYFVYWMTVGYKYSF